MQATRLTEAIFCAASVPGPMHRWYYFRRRRKRPGGSPPGPPDAVSPAHGPVAPGPATALSPVRNAPPKSAGNPPSGPAATPDLSESLCAAARLPAVSGMPSLPGLRSSSKPPRRHLVERSIRLPGMIQAVGKFPWIPVPRILPATRIIPRNGASGARVVAARSWPLGALPTRMDLSHFPWAERS